MEETAGQKREKRKARYKEKFETMIHQFKNCLVVGIDNVGSSQLAKIRAALRGKAELVMGKNTLMRKLIRDNLEKNPKLEALLPHIIGNMGFVFSNSDLTPIRDVIVQFKVPAAAKAGSIAPTDVFVPPGPTGLDPGQTGFFQALNIATKIARGSIEIINEVHLVKPGDKVTSSAVALLGKLDIKPFFFGVQILQVYEDGAVYPASVLNITPAELTKKFMNGVGKLTALSLQLNWPNQLTLPIQLQNAFRKILAIGLSTNYTFKQSEAFLKSASEKPKEEEKEKPKEEKSAGKGKKVEEKPKEEEQEDENAGVGGLFD